MSNRPIIFLSGTFKDLEEHRKAVLEQLPTLEINGSAMEYFGADQRDVTTFSLTQLERCNVYVGIIGHRFGKLSPDSRNSITQCEYNRAFELYEKKEMSILIFLAHDTEFAGKVGHRENHVLEEKQRVFRELLKARHTPKEFTTPTELAGKVGSALLALAKGGDTPPEPPRLHYFKKDEIEAFEKMFDKSDTRPNRIRGFLDDLTGYLAGLLPIDQRQKDSHPFFQAVHEQIAKVLPNVFLDEESGALRRAGIRHVVFRQQTALLLARKVPENELASVGEEIGGGAASDLLQHAAIENRMIPDSVEAFISLWNYWDYTGGWGKLSLETSATKADGKKTGEAPPKWHIRLENNFLCADALKNPAPNFDLVAETHRLCQFWCGYIKGFLNVALPGISQAIQASEDRRASRYPLLPAYHSVASVEHDPDHQLHDDVFIVTFVREEYADTREALNTAVRVLNDEQDCYMVGVFCQTALRHVNAVCGTIDTEAVSKLGLSAERVATIGEISKAASKPGDCDHARRWCDALSDLLGKLTQSDVSEP